MNYNKKDITSSLNKLKLEKGDSLFIHSNIGFFGILEGAKDIDDICEIFFDTIFNFIGENGTIFVPSFTYSFPKGEIFDPLIPPKMGAFSDWIFRYIDSIRSYDSSYSVIGIGKNALRMIENTPINSFGENSFFERFYQSGGKILNLNFDAGSTLIHYFERLLNVPYRFDKSFDGISLIEGKEVKTNSTIFVRYLSDDSLEYSSKLFTEIALKKTLFYNANLGRGSIGLISSQDTFKLIKDEIKFAPYFLTKAEMMGIKEPNIIKE